MKIGNDYGAFQNKGYDQSHSHHVTKCLNEEENKKPEGGMESRKPGSDAEISKGVVYEKNIRYDYAPFEKKDVSRRKKTPGLSMVKGFWDALGEEENEGQVNPARPVSFREHVLPGIVGAASAFREKIADRIVNKWEAAKERIRTQASAALKKFGKGREAFTALSDQKTPSNRRNPYARKEKMSGQAGGRKKEEEIPMKPLVHSHLMDSYSKTGAYCQLNENLTFQKPAKEAGAKSTLEKPEKMTGKEEHK